MRIRGDVEACRSTSSCFGFLRIAATAFLLGFVGVALVTHVWSADVDATCALGVAAAVFCGMSNTNAKLNMHPAPDLFHPPQKQHTIHPREHNTVE